MSDWQTIFPRFVLTCAVLLLLSCHQTLVEKQWSVVGQSLSNWTCLKVGKFVAADRLDFAAKESKWELFFFDSLKIAPGNVCFFAPDSLQFQLTLNDNVLVYTENHSGAWPSSFSSDNIFIYPNNQNLRPFVIDSTNFMSCFINGKNKLEFRVFSGPINLDQIAKCCLYAESSDLSRTAVDPAFSNVLYKQGKLPRVDILVEGVQLSRESKSKGNLRLTCSSNVIGECDEADKNILLKIRGFSSSEFPKKQFSFSITSDSLKREKISLLGMNRSSRWILQGPFSDPSLIRNAFVYDIWRKMGYWAPQSRFVELVLNNNYQGVYLLMERVEISPSRLNLDTHAPNSDAFLVLKNRPIDTDSTVMADGVVYILDDPPGIVLTAEYQSKVQAALKKMSVQSLGPFLNNQFVNWESFADYILLEEVVKNIDAYYVSTYMHKNDSAVDNRIVAGPVWDFDRSMGSSIEKYANEHNGFMYESSNKTSAFFRNICRQTEFQEMLKTRYKLRRQNLLDDNNLDDMIDSLVSNVSVDAINRNFIRFPIYGLPKFYHHPGMAKDYASEILAMKSWLHNRLSWLDSKWIVEGNEP